MEIHRIETGKVRIRQNQVRKAQGFAPKLAKVFFDRQWTDWLPIFAWVIEHPEGIMVVDTGETYKTGSKGYLPRWHPYYARAVDFDVQPEEEIGPQMEELGMNPEKDVSKVIMTHLHTDHAGGLHHFPHADILIERNEYKAASGISGIMRGYLPHRWPKWLKTRLITLPEVSYGPFLKSMSLTDDGTVTLVSTPGHVADHLSVIVEMEGIYYFLAGDTSYTEENMLQSIPDGVGTAGSIDTLRRIQEFAQQHPTIYLPSHDPDVPRRMDEKAIVPVYEESNLQYYENYS